MRGNKVDCFKGLKQPLKQNKTKLVDVGGLTNQMRQKRHEAKDIYLYRRAVPFRESFNTATTKKKPKKNPSNLGGHEGNLNR